MLALKLRKNGSPQLQLLGVSEILQKLLRDLGVAKLFKFVLEGESVSGGESVSVTANRSMLTTAETVAEAHRTLVEADRSNAKNSNRSLNLRIRMLPV